VRSPHNSDIEDRSANITFMWMAKTCIRGTAAKNIKIIDGSAVERALLFTLSAVAARFFSNF
jgi:hypothetical protein